METEPTLHRHSSGRFVKGQTGNPNGRPRGSTSHIAELRRREESALTLAANTADVIAETAQQALAEIEHPELIPLIDAICGAAKAAVKDGEIGPSSVSLLRTWYDDHQDDPKGSFFIHVGLPADCEWSVFLAHYRTLGRIDHCRHAEDFNSYSPIAQRIKELKAECLMSPDCDAPLEKLKIGLD